MFHCYTLQWKLEELTFQQHFKKRNPTNPKPSFSNSAEALQVVTGLEVFLTKAAASHAPRGAASAAAAFGDRQGTLDADQALDVERPLHWRRSQWPGQGAAVAYSAALAAAINGTVLRLHRARGAAGKAGELRPVGF